MAGFHIEHFGCRAARADGEAIAGNLRAVAERETLAAEVVVVNTCSVTAEADRAARAFIRKAHRRNPAAKIVVTGCYAQRAPEELAAMPGVAAVVGNSHKALAPGIIVNLARGGNVIANGLSPVLPVASLLSAGTLAAPMWVDDRFAHSFIEDVHLADGKHLQGAQTRPNLKIQEGCGNRCTFCVIPFTRGPSKSLPRAAVLREVEKFVDAGGKELVLSGINLGRWGREAHDREPGSLSQLVREILETTALPRLRLSSIEPMDWDDELIEVMSEYGGRRLARHAHLPLQSGSDAVLRRMHRRYRPWHYAEKIGALVRAAGDELTIGADVMIGFPGETDGEFAETVAFIRSLPLGYLHLFPFSPRPGTRAWALQEALPVPQRKMDERMSALRALAAEIMHARRSRFLGRKLPAITLRTAALLAARGCTEALTDNFLPVELEARLGANQLVEVRVHDVNDEGILLAS
jgi:threonylcarbamoyladenosine tRNA methylthiotransferase MtaB